MNYSQDPILNFPYSNPVTKTAMCVGAAYLVFMGIRYAKKDDGLPQQRRARQGFTTSKIDHDVDSRNRAYGVPVPSNPNVPFYSRHNYNRRRRSKNFW